MNLPQTLGVVETNSVDYIHTLFTALADADVVVPLRSHDDSTRIAAANVERIVTPDTSGGWLEPRLELSPDDALAHIAFTSGTEGLPKGVFITRSALCDATDRLQSVMAMTADVKEYVGVPVYHSFGYGRCRHIALVGGQLYIPAHGFDPREVATMLAAGAINALSLVPSLLRVFLNNPTMLGDERFHLRWLEIGSQAMSRDEKVAVRALFPNARIIQHYGLTEASRSTLLQIDGADDATLNSVGKAYGDTELMINSEGRICIKGSHVARSLLKEGHIVSALNADGWLETTDLGRLENGLLYFDGRADNVVNCGGQKLSTERFEAELAFRLDCDSSAVAVSRIPHSIYGEGFLVSYTSGCLSSDIKAVAVECLSALGVAAKNALLLNPVDAIPKTHTGKTQHKQLTADYAARNVSGASTEPVVTGIVFAFANSLGMAVSDIDTSWSIRDIGVDSIQSVQLSLQLESWLGYLPSDWREQSIISLTSLPRIPKEVASSQLRSPKKGKAAPIWDGSSNKNPSDVRFWALVKEDYVTHGRELFSQGFFALFVHRFGNWRMGIQTKFLRAPMTLLYRILIKFVQVLCGIKLDYTVHVGRRVKLEHFGGMILGARSIGDETIIRQNTTFGIRDMSDLSAKPTIERGVNIGAGAVIVGDITIGRYSVIGPNCVITEDLLPFSVVAAAPNVVTRVDLDRGSVE